MKVSNGSLEDVDAGFLTAQRHQAKEVFGGRVPAVHENLGVITCFNL